jgi:hypothetical protein
MPSVVPIVIHMSRAPERLDAFRRDNQAALVSCASSLERALAALAAGAADAADVARVSRRRSEDAFLVFEGVPHKKGMVGCKLSHLAVGRIARALAASLGAATVVFEDDARCMYADKFRDFLASVREDADPCWGRVAVVNAGPAFMRGAAFPDGYPGAAPTRLAHSLWLVPIPTAALLHAYVIMPRFAEELCALVSRRPLAEAPDRSLPLALADRPIPALAATCPALFWQRPEQSSTEEGLRRDMDDAMRSSDLMLQHVVHCTLSSPRIFAPTLQCIEDAVPHVRVIHASEAFRVATAECGPAQFVFVYFDRTAPPPGADSVRDAMRVASRNNALAASVQRCDAAERHQLRQALTRIDVFHAANHTKPMRERRPCPHEFVPDVAWTQLRKPLAVEAPPEHIRRAGVLTLSSLLSEQIAILFARHYC